ncbi:uncharacterized protein LOC130630210 [Hydractinia symbiolongicarpus]|uniref:uncharacterized protein LOC130630210 n=1 Tax=Hydractinia symbiolongicarpus TaxID=13093 RepID=UPI00254BC0FC|nr:uncharacterized protein LOC130630210 [Hydractinia symbiolongicarpus]
MTDSSNGSLDVDNPCLLIFHQAPMMKMKWFVDSQMKEPSMENNPDHSHDYLSSGEEILPGDEYYANNIQNECFELQDATNEIQMLSDTESGSSTFGISECSSHETDFSENEILANENVDELLYENSNITVLSFSHLLLLFSVKHNLSGEATKNLLKLFATVLPENNKCPLTMSKLKKISKQFQHRKTHYQVCQHCHSQLDKQLHCFNEVCRESHPIQDALSFYILDIESQLRSIVTGKLNKFETLFLLVSVCLKYIHERSKTKFLYIFFLYIFYFIYFNICFIYI